ncbi:MAG TPA: hypothetical protein VK506_07930 [Conexibacter sp.]|nr:hypothetical protein [Conexibacter sp.]
MRSRRLTTRWCAFALLALAAAPAQAWTETRVETAGAHLEVLPAGRARVSLRVGVQVLGGWLSRLELDGLDPKLALDPDAPPVMHSEDGQQLLPETRIDRAGRVLITFPSRSRAPRRGRHSLVLTYLTQLASEPSRDGQRTLHWSLPAFRADLRDVEVTVDAPLGAQPSADGDGATTISRTPHGERIVLRWQRAQLPRTLAFTASFRVPASAAARPADGSVPQAGRAPAFGGSAGWAALALLLLTCAKRAMVRASCRCERARALPLLGMLGLPRALAALALALAAAWLYGVLPLLGGVALAALSACALDRGFASLPVSQPRWTRARIALELTRIRHTRARRLLGVAAWLDATTPLGLGSLACCWALAVLRADLGAGIDVWLEALLAATPLWFSATRRALPPTPVERLYAQRTLTRAGEDRPALDRAA